MHLRRPSLRSALSLPVALGLALSTQAATLYWDTNAATAGSGNAGGTWDTGTNWTSDATGTSATSSWTDGSDVVFAAGTDFNTTVKTVTLGGTVLTQSILVEETALVNLTGGSMDITGGAIFNTSVLGATTGRSLTWSSNVIGTGGLTLAVNGDTSVSGGGSSTIFALTGTNTFTGNVTITSGVVGYSSGFGDAANSLILNGGGLVFNNTGSLARNLDIGVSGGVLRAYGSATGTHSGSLTGSGTVTRTDGGTVIHSGDISAFTGTYSVQIGTSTLTGTAAAIGGNWVVATGATLNINSTVAQSLAGTVTGTGTASFNVSSTTALDLNGAVNLGTGSFNITGNGKATITSSFNADQISMLGTTSELNISTGAVVTTKYLNIGNSGNNSGRVIQTGGSVTIATGGTGMRIGHWNNGANPGSLYTLSGGTLDASAISVTIGHDGQGDMIVGGGAGAALFRANGIQLDANGNGGGSGAGDMTLTVSNNGTVEVGSGGIGAAAAGDRVILNGGSVKAVANTSWNSVFDASNATTSTLDAGNFAVNLTNSLTGTGTIALTAGSGSISLGTSGSQTISAPLSGSLNLVKTGTGTTTLAGTDTFGGSFTVNDGRLNLAGNIFAPVTVSSAKTLGGEGVATGLVTLNSAILGVDPTTAGNLTVTDLTLNGTSNIRFDITPAVAGGAFNVLTYTGTLTGAIGTNLVLENAAKYRNSTLVDTAGLVTLDIQSKALTWNGTSGGQWDVLTSSRWNISEADQFAWGDSVSFDNSGVATTLTLTGELQPSSLTFSGTQNYTLNGGAGNFLSGVSGITKSGSSTVVLNSPNTLSGANFITDGVLQIGNGTNNTATLGTGAASVSSGATLSFLRNGSSTVANAFSGTGTIAFLGNGVSGQSDYSLTGSNTGFSGTLDIRSGARVQVDNTADVGTSSLVVNSGGQLWLNGAITYSNAVSLNGIGWTEAAGNLGAVRFTSGTLSGNVTLAGNTRLTSYNSGDTGFITGVVTDGAGTFSLTKTGAGTVTLGSANTYDGGTALSAGTLQIRNAGSLGTGNVIIGDTATGTSATALYLDTNRVTFVRPILVSANGTGTVTLGTRSTITGTGAGNGFNGITLNRDVIFDSNAADRTDYANISGVGNISVGGAGRSIFSSANTFSGTLTINSITDANGLQLGTNSTAFNAIPDTTNVTVNSGGKLSLSFTAGGTETIGGLNGAGSVRNNGGNANTIIVGGGNGGGTFSGLVENGGAGAFSFTKIGTGVQILSGANTYTGATTVTGGLLRLNGATSLPGGLAATGGVSNLSLNGGVIGLGQGDLLRGLGTGVTQVQLAGTSGFAAFTAARAVNFGGANAAVTWGSGSFAPTTLVLGHSTADFTVTISNPIDLASAARAVQADDGTAIVDGQLSGVLSGATGSLIKTGTGTLSLSGANTYGGATTINAGTLYLDYTNQNNSKLADAALTFGAGATTLSLNAGSHTEVVASTTLSVGATASITRPSGTSVLQLGTIARNANATLSLGASGIATTSSTNTNGILGTWATTGGDWAANSTNGTNGPINAYAAYTDVTRLSSGTKAIADAIASNVRIIEGTGTAANVTLAAATTNINTLNMSATGGATIITMTSGTLRLGTAGGILAGSGVSALTIGSAVNQGTLTAGGNAANVAGEIALVSNSANNIGINSVIANNGTGAVSLFKTGTGTVSLAGTNTYTGGTIISGGTLAISSATAPGTVGGSLTGFGTGAVTVNTGGAAWIHGSGSSFGTIANAWTLAGGTLHIQDGATTFSGTVGVSAASVVQEYWGDTITFSGVISGAGGLTFQRAPGGGENAAFLLGGVNNTTGTITAGANITVRLGNASALGNTSAGTSVTSGGVLDLNGLTVGAEPLTLNGTGISSGGSLVNSSATAASLSGAVTLASASSIGGSGNLTLSGVVSGPGFGLSKVGAGILTLSANNTYNGTTTVTAGRLNLSGTNASNLSFAGATLGGVGSTTGSLTTNAGSVIALNGITPTSGFTASGVVNFAGSTSLIFDAVPTALGTTAHTVATYGSLPNGITNLSGPTGYRSTISNDTTNKKVLLNVTTGTRTWNQSAPATWNNLTATSFAEGDLMFANGDAVVFDDTATNGAVTLTGTLLPGSVSVNNSATAYTFSGAGSIGGAASLAKSGAGTLTVTNVNAYTGTTTVSGGVLNIQNANALGATSAGTTVSAGAQLQLQGGITTAAEPLSLSGTGPASSGALSNVSGNNTYGGAISLASASSVSVATGTQLATTGGFTGGNTLTKIGDGTLRFQGYGSNAFAGSLVIDAGTVTFGSGVFNGNIGLSSITVNNGGTLLSPTGTAHSLGGYIAATPALTINSGGSYTIGQEQYVNTINLAGGSVLAQSGGANPEVRTDSSFQVNATSGSSVWTAKIGGVNQNFRFNVSTGADLAVSGVISGAFAVQKSGAGTLVLTGANTYSTGTILSGGTLGFASGSLGSTGAIAFSASSTLRWENGNTQDVSTRLAAIGSGVTATLDTNGNDVELASVLSGAGSLAKNGAGNLTLSGNNTYSGGTTLNGGTATAGHVNGFGTGSITLATGATLNLNSLSLTNPITNNGGTIIGANGSATILQNGGTLSGNVGGIITASGTVAGSPTITGTIQGTATFTGAVTIANGAFAKGTANFSGGLVINSGGTLSPGNSPGTTSAGDTVWNGGGNYVWELNSVAADPGTNQDFLSITGTLTLNATPLNKFNLKVTSLTALNAAGAVPDFASAHPGYTWTIVTASGGITGFDADAINIDLTNFVNPNVLADWQVQNIGNDISLVYVPEPSTYAALAGLSVLGLAWNRRRQRRRTAQALSH